MTAIIVPELGRQARVETRSSRIRQGGLFGLPGVAEEVGEIGREKSESGHARTMAINGSNIYIAPRRPLAGRNSRNRPPL